MGTSLERELRDAWASAPDGDVVVRIHLFGIKHAEQLRGRSLREPVGAAGVPQTYVTEIRKGVRLADYVRLR